MANIVFLSVKKDIPANRYWDQAFLKDLFSEIDLSESDRTVVVIPGAYQTDVVDELNKQLAKYEKVLVIVTSDEENKFNAHKLSHPDMILWSQYGNGGKMFPLGYTPKTREILKEDGLQYKQGWFFSGQVTHLRRQQLVDELRKRSDGFLHETDGFAKGFLKEEFLQRMNKAKVVPCPSGTICVESFRLYEALEAGAVPIADDISSLQPLPTNYWQHLFGSVPFPIYQTMEQLNHQLDFSLNNPYFNNLIYSWWVGYKYNLKQRLKRDLGIAEPEIAVVIPVSPIPSHPHTHIVEETIQSIRTHLDSPILVSIDGVRSEQKYQEANYLEFIRRFLWKCNFEYTDVIPIIFNKHSHQSGMLKEILPIIQLPFILYVEQDTPLTPDCEIDWGKVKEFIRSKESNLVRFHFESHVLDEHKHLMVGEPKDGFWATKQWSQRPHLAYTDYYRYIMDKYFSKKSNTFIEDRMHSVLQDEDWDKHRLHIYHPKGNIKRSYHLDGREGQPKYDDKLKY